MTFTNVMMGGILTRYVLDPQVRDAARDAEIPGWINRNRYTKFHVLRSEPKRAGLPPLELNVAALNAPKIL